MEPRKQTSSKQRVANTHAKRAHFAHCTNVTAQYQPIGVWGYGGKGKVSSHLARDIYQPLTQTNKNVNIVFGQMGWSPATDTDKQTKLIHKYILYFSTLNHGPISAKGHLYKSISSWTTMCMLAVEKWQKCFCQSILLISEIVWKQGPIKI
jgi:hypothetical protein